MAIIFLIFNYRLVLYLFIYVNTYEMILFIYFLNALLKIQRHLILNCLSFFDLTKYERQVFHISSLPTAPHKPIRSRMWRKATLMPWWGTIHFEQSESIIWGTLIFFCKICKTSGLIADQGMSHYAFAI